MMILVLPFPPSVNGYWRAVGGRNILSARGRAYRDAALAVIAAQPHQPFPETARLDVQITFHAPSHQERDLDNYLKGCLDSLTRTGVYPDDSQIDALDIVRGVVRPRTGILIIRIEIATAPPPEISEDIERLIATLPLPLPKPRRAAAKKAVA